MSRVFHLSKCHQMPRVLLTGSSPLLRCQSLPTDTSFGCFVTSHGFSVFILRLPKSEAYRVEPFIPKPSIPYPFFHIHSLPSLSLFTIAIHSQCQFQSYSYHGITLRNILTSLTYTISYRLLSVAFRSFHHRFSIRSPRISTQGFAHVKGVLVTGIVTSHSTLGFLSWSLLVCIQNV